MLTKFAVTNYRGFAKRIEWDLSHPANYGFNTHVIKDGIIKNGIVYGPNGSGKSNFSLALFDITSHLAPQPLASRYDANFIYAGDMAGVVTFEYTFRFGSDSVEYVYAKNAKKQLVSEKLIVNNKTIVEMSESVAKIIEDEFPLMLNASQEFLDKNANVVSAVAYLMKFYPLPSKEHYLMKLQRFVESMLWFRCVEGNEYQSVKTMDVVDVQEYIINNNLLEDFSTFLKEVSDQECHFVTENTNGKVILCEIDGVTIPFMLIASTGTRALLGLFYWLQRMGEASFVFIDEFDAFYHFRLAFEVCQRLFRLPCQVFTSSHNTYLMTNDLLRPDCNFILNNNQIKSFGECTDKELRFAHNIEKIYRAEGFTV